MSESNSNVIPAINAVDGFNPADFVRTTVGEEGENDLYLDVKYRLLWFRLHHPNGKIDPELIRVDEKNAIVCCRIYADKADPADQFIGKAYSQRFSTEDRFGDRFLEIAETVAKGRALADAGYGTQFCMNGETLASIIADAPIKMPPDEDAGHPGSVVASFTAQPTADAQVFSQAATAPSIILSTRWAGSRRARACCIIPQARATILCTTYRPRITAPWCRSIGILPLCPR